MNKQLQALCKALGWQLTDADEPGGYILNPGDGGPLGAISEEEVFGAAMQKVEIGLYLLGGEEDE